MTRSLCEVCPAASTTRTTPTWVSFAANPVAKAAVNVARPHAVGGKELRTPKERPRPSRPSMGKFGTRTGAPQRDSVEASNLHGAASADTAVLPKRSDSPKGTSPPAYREYQWLVLSPQVGGSPSHGGCAQS